MKNTKQNTQKCGKSNGYFNGHKKATEIVAIIAFCAPNKNTFNIGRKRFI